MNTPHIGSSLAMATSPTDVDIQHEVGGDDIETEALLNGASEMPSPPGDSKRILLFALPALLLCTFVARFDSSFVIGNYSRRIGM
jgi:hypothetical protein